MKLQEKQPHNKNQKTMTLIITKAILVASCLAAAASASPLLRRQSSQGSSLVQDAPLAGDLAGVHLLLNNDLDSNTPKHPVIFLAEARSYKDSRHVCDTLGEDLVNSGNLGFAKDLLDITPIAANDLKKVTRLWVKNADTSSSSCTAFDRKSGDTVQLPCSTHLPALCANTLPRSQIGPDIHTDKTNQIKVRTPHAGTYQGYHDQNQFRFLGIKYAQPPVGRLRFLPPQRMKAGDADKAKDATKYGFVCMQGAYEGDAKPNATYVLYSLGAPENEDCLHLNVFTPTLPSKQEKKGLPVMVYVHGGGFTSFSGSSPVFEPGNLVSRGGVVVVTLNYRLGIFGFFESPPSIPHSKATGNLAIRDQIAALQWVQDNIVAFGGDPDQVTIFGESAGGYSMRALLSVPAAFGLYRNVISQSDLLGIPFSSPKIAGQIGAGLLKYLGCSPSDLACAQSKTADQVRNVEHNATMDVVLADGNEWLMTAGGVYRPTIDGDFFPGDFADLVRTGRYNRKANILWGTTRDEAAAFLPYVFPEPIPLDEKDKALAGYLLEDRTKKLFTSPAYALNRSDNDTIRSELSVAITDLLWACAVQRMSRGTASQHSKVYTYRMDHGRDIYSTFGEPFPPFCRGRVCHADDVIPSFGSGDVKDGTVQTGSDARFSRQVIDRFVTFAKTGNPNPKKKDSGLLGLAERNADVTSVQWPEYVDGEDRVFVFEETTGRVEVGKDTERCQWIEKNVHYDYQVHAPNGKFVPIFP
ncbi:Carboxylesterase family-domain-containing protein [Linnemannia elongata]|nr:Carboxylesterase family-domain-containing protein [Linnemannia elongata]